MMRIFGFTTFMVALAPAVFAQDASTCFSQLQAADNNGDMRLTSDEYISFLALRSDDRLDFDAYSQLPLSLLSPYMFGACACTLTSGDPQCCLGDNANIVLDEESDGFSVDTLFTFCRSVDSSIQSILAATPSPTSLLTDSPSEAPVVDASDPPSDAPTLDTVAPSVKVSGSPSDTPTMVTLAPTVQTSHSPSSTPTLVTLAPSVVVTDPLPSIPTDSPNVIVTDVPTASPSDATPLPSISPSKSPTSSPTPLPSISPSKSPTSSPTSLPSISPSKSPTVAPTQTPTAMTPRPTAENELCIRFQYGIINNVGVTADEIFNMVNNTYKNGLIVATENVTIESLNASFPEERFLRTGVKKNSKELHRHSGNLIVPIEFFDSILPDGFILEEPLNAGRKRDRRLTAAMRKLVFYTEIVPPEIISIIDNSFCPSESPSTECAIVTSRTCVFLEDEDEPAVVREMLSAGISSSIASGEFEAAIPEEDRLE